MAKALVVGCGYAGTAAELKGAIPDTHTMKLIIETAWPKSDVSVLDDDPFQNHVRPTRTALMTSLRNFEFHSLMSVWTFSGHGTQMPGDGEYEPLDEMIVASDMKHVSDNELRTFAQRTPEGHVLLVICDSCHSGTILDLPTELIDDGAGYYLQTTPSKLLDTKGVVICISGCRDDQTSADTPRGGALTLAFNTVTKGGRYLRKMSLFTLMREINIELNSQGFKQRAMLTCSEIIWPDYTLDSMLGDRYVP